MFNSAAAVRQASHLYLGRAYPWPQVVLIICGSGFFTPVWEWEWEWQIIWEWDREWEREWEQIIFREWIREWTFYCLYFFVLLFYTPTGNPLLRVRILFRGKTPVARWITISAILVHDKDECIHFLIQCSCTVHVWSPMKRPETSMYPLQLHSINDLQT
jgi:hypothetical protein